MLALNLTLRARLKKLLLRKTQALTGFWSLLALGQNPCGFRITRKGIRAHTKYLGGHHEQRRLHRRAVKAATQSILRKGYDVIDTDWESVCGGHIDLVAKDHDELVFIDVTVSEDQEKGFLDGNPNQNQMEIMAARWLAASSPADGDLQVRFDTISLIVLNEQRAFMRHHTNVFSQA